MTVIRTVKTKILFDEAQAAIIKETMLDCLDVFNHFAQLACEHKSTSYMTLHKYGYNEAKLRHPNLPTAYIQSSAKQALACVKSFNTQNKKRKWQYKGAKKSLQLQLNKLTLSRRGELTTFSTNHKRVRIEHQIPTWFVERYNINTNKFKAGTLKYFPKTNEFVLAFIYEVETPIPNIYASEIIGIDRGLYNLVSLSTGENISAKHCKAVKRKYQYLRKKLQQKGTKSAKRHLKKLSGKEKRFMLDVNHCISKSLAANKNVSTYVLEDLKGIRDRRKGKKLNSWLSNWSYFQLQALLEYKCKYNGINVVYIDQKYTSQKCSVCDNIDKNNRNKQYFTCTVCGHTEHADINAAKNIKHTYVKSLENELLEQVAVNLPVVSGESLDTKY